MTDAFHMYNNRKVFTSLLLKSTRNMIKIIKNKIARFKIHQQGFETGRQKKFQYFSMKRLFGFRL